MQHLQANGAGVDRVSARTAEASFPRRGDLSAERDAEMSLREVAISFGGEDAGVEAREQVAGAKFGGEQEGNGGDARMDGSLSSLCLHAPIAFSVSACTHAHFSKEIECTPLVRAARVHPHELACVHCCCVGAGVHLCDHACKRDLDIIHIRVVYVGCVQKSPNTRGSPFGWAGAGDVCQMKTTKRLGEAQHTHRRGRQTEWRRLQVRSSGRIP